MIIVNEREVMIMNTFVIKYATISPAVLASIVEHNFNCLCNWYDINEDFFEIVVFWGSINKAAELEDFLLRYS